MSNNSTIVTAFLSAYELGGVAYNAFMAVRELHDLGYTPRTKPLSNKWQHYYCNVLPKQVQEQTEAFDFSTIDSGRISPIIAEIDNRLSGLVGDERERYLFSLLTPFAELAKIYHPTATPKEQAEVCSSMIEQNRGNIERLHQISKRFCDVVFNSERGTIEYYCSVWVDAATQFANRLDALLLTYGVDLLQLQETSGIYLKDYRVITDVDYYIGSFELAQHYINALPHLAHEEPATGRELPRELDTDQARKYFARAVAAGLMSEQFKWLATKAQLGYFCYNTYSQPRPLTALERFFDVKKLSSDITNASMPAKRADVKKWRAKQDKEIFFD